jgi:nitrogen regulatory protein PII 2
MKQIIAILRDERVEETKKALDTVGVRGVTFLYVTGRGQQKGRVSVPHLGEIPRNIWMQVVGGQPGECQPGAGPVHQKDTEFASGFLPKRMLIIVAYDEEINQIVQAIVNANQTGRHGDGRIFICPMISALRVRTGEQSDRALS